MGKKIIYSAEDIPEPIDGVIYLEPGTEIRTTIDLGPNKISLKELEEQNTNASETEDKE